MAGIDHIFEGRMAEWLRPRVFIAETGLNIRRICGGSNPAAKKSIGWAVGAKATSRRYYGRRKPIYIFWQQDGRVVKLQAYEENGLNIRRIRGGSSPAAKTVHRLGGW